MIPHTALPVQTPSWQEELARLIRDPNELIELLQLPRTMAAEIIAASRKFPLHVPRPYAARIEPGNINDPLLRQVLPLGDELIATPGFSADPLGEAEANPHPGLIHKYQGRALLIVNGNCAINCRFCFRREFPYSDNKPGREQWLTAFDYIANDPSISEVIFSGGDPLTSSDRQLLWMAEQLAAIPHVQRLRIHTRLPIVIPSRITDDCLHWLTTTRLKPIVVIHSNHPNEIDDKVIDALKRLQMAGITLLNQCVLLRQINDDANCLAKLNQSLFAAGVLPYYLHLIDRVSGSAHFEVSERDALNILDQLTQSLPGYLVPKLVREEKGAASKTPIVLTG